MEQLKDYLTKEGWRRDWDKSVDRYVQNKWSANRLAYSAMTAYLSAPLFMGGSVADRIPQGWGLPMAVTGMVVAVQSMIWFNAGLIKVRQEAKEGIERTLEAMEK